MEDRCKSTGRLRASEDLLMGAVLVTVAVVCLTKSLITSVTSSTADGDNISEAIQCLCSVPVIVYKHFRDGSPNCKNALAAVT